MDLEKNKSLPNLGHVQVFHLHLSLASSWGLRLARAAVTKCHSPDGLPQPNAVLSVEYPLSSGSYESEIQLSAKPCFPRRRERASLPRVFLAAGGCEQSLVFLDS